MVIDQTGFPLAGATRQKALSSRPSMTALLDEQIPDSLLRLGLYLRNRKVALALLGNPVGKLRLTTLRVGREPYLCAKTSDGLGPKGWLAHIFLPLDDDSQTKRRILGGQGWRRVVSIHLYLLGLETPRFLRKVLRRRCYRRRNL